MNEKRIKDFTPIHPKKASFFKALLAFYVSTTATTEVLSAEQAEIKNVLNAFDASGSFIHKYDVSNVSVLNADVVKKMRPTMHGKVALYDALVAFFDATLADKKKKDEENGNAEDDFITLAVSCIPNNIGIGISIIAPCIREEVAKKIEDKKKKHYTINVHYDAVCTVEVDAMSEQEAIDKAIDIANNTDTHEFDFDYDDSCIVDIE